MSDITRRTLIQTLAAVPAVAALSAQASRKTRNVLLVMSDGLRWQEIFGGADAALINKENGVSDPDALRKDYWRPTAEARREALMPFFWQMIGKQGQVFGNRTSGSEMAVTNGMNFSYPGYNETLCGFPDPRIDGNDKNPNPNVTVFEWLNRKPAFHGKVAAFGAWDTFPYIFNAPRSGILVNAGYDPLVLKPQPERIALINQLKAETNIWDGEPFDPFTLHTALEYVKLRKPRLLFLGLGETDEWAHHGEYATYLGSIRRVDQSLKMLWETVQAIPEYRGTTTMIVTCDHGRGDAPVEWRNHGQKVPDSKYIWAAFVGPDTPSLGERRNTAALGQNQIAATLAEFLGEDYHADVPKAGRAIEEVLSH